MRGLWQIFSAYNYTLDVYLPTEKRLQQQHWQAEEEHDSYAKKVMIKHLVVGNNHMMSV